MSFLVNSARIYLVEKRTCFQAFLSEIWAELTRNDKRLLKYRKIPKIRDRSFFMREGGPGGIWGGGGALEKNWLERGGQPKKNEGRGGSDEKIRLKIG